MKHNAPIALAALIVLAVAPLAGAAGLFVADDAVRTSPQQGASGAVAARADASPKDAGALADSFPLGVYWPWERTAGLAKRNGLDKWAFVERCLDRLKTDGFDAVWAVNLGIDDLPELAQRLAARRMQLVPALGELHYNIAWRRNNWTYLEKESKRALAAAGEAPSILAWALCDEPGRAIVEEMEAYRRKFVTWGAAQPTVVVTMWPDSPTYAEQARFDVVCTDVYPFFSSGNPNGPNTPAGSRAWYRRQAKMTADAAEKAGRPPWIMPQCFVDVWGPWRYDARLDAEMLPGAILHWRQPSVGEIRWQVWSAVGAGLKGFFWYVYLPPSEDRPDAKRCAGSAFPPTLAVDQVTPTGGPGGMLRPDGSPTPHYTAVAEAFAALRPLTRLLAQCVRTDPPLGETSRPGWIGGLKNDKLKRTFAVVVNDDTDREQTITIRLRQAWQVRDLRSGQTLAPSADNTVNVRLLPGDGTVLEAIPSESASAADD